MATRQRQAARRARRTGPTSTPGGTAWLAPVAALALLAAGCGTATDPAGSPGGTDGPGGPEEPVSDGDPGSGGAGTGDGSDLPGWRAQDPGLVLTGHGLVLQQEDDPPELCVGGVAESYPPQCGGPELVGFDWDDAPEHESAAGVTWGYATVVGTFDGERLHLSEPATQEPPDRGDDPDGPAAPDLPQLCDDPFRGGDPQWQQEAAAPTAADDLGRAVQDLDGYVTMWVSDGRDLYNVIVTGDPEQAHARLREVWPGGLCVEQRDLPTQEQLRAAQAEVEEAREEIGLLSSGSGGADGRLHVGVLVADEATVAAVHEAVRPHLSPEHVEVYGALRPVTDER